MKVHIIEWKQIIFWTYFEDILKIFEDIWKSNKSNLVWCFSKLKTVFLEQLTSDFFTKSRGF